MILQDKKGADKIIIIYWFAILVLVAAGVFSMVLSFQTPYDVRELEASILADQIADYLAPQGVLVSDISSILGESSIDEISDKANLTELTTAIKGEGSSCNCGDSCENYANWIFKYSEENGILDPLLVVGLMIQESLCVSTSASGSSVGLMQINLDHCGEFDLPADETTCRNELINNPEKNIQIGTQILRDSYNSYSIGKLFSEACTDEYKQKTYFGWEAALRGYNGWGCGLFKQGSQKGEKIITQDYYVDQVMIRYNNLRQILGKEPVSGELQFDILNKSKLTFGGEIENSQYYTEMNFFNFSSNKNLGLIKEGNINLKADCKVQDDKEYKRLSKCFERSFYAVDGQNNPYSIKILTVVRKTEQNVA